MDPATRKKLSYGLFYSLMLVLAVFAVMKSLRTERAKYPFDSHLLRTKTDPMDAAISPDGKQVALVHRQDVGSDTNQVDLLDASTGQQVTSVTLPSAQWHQNFAQYFISKPLRFCNNGKYILAFDDLDTLYVLDSSSLHPHSSISLNGLRILLGDPKRKLPTLLRTPTVSVACALHSPLALIVFDVAGGVVSLMDLDTASDVEDVAGSFTNRWNLDAFAISPSGSQIAIASSGLGSGSSRNLAVLEARTQKKLYDTVLRFNEDSDLEVAFAGESALVVAERGCPGNFCFKTPVPHGRTLTVWNFGEDGSVREFGVDGAETYKWTGASSDGSVIYAYTGTEKFCKSCNGGSGELKIEDARFMLWDRRTGKPLARSPKLQVQDHRCPTVLILGACTAYQQSPELQLSENGNAMLAFWPRGTTPWQKDEERIVQVLTRHE